MKGLYVQFRNADGWQTAFVVKPGDPGGSLSHNGPAGRQIYQIVVTADGARIMHSKGGIDFEPTPMLRMISTVGFEPVATINDQAPDYECWLKPGRVPVPVRFRFRWDHIDYKGGR